MITVREAGHELRVQVLDGRAYVAIVAVDGAEDPEAWTRTVSLPARRLHALVRAAWADDQYGATGPLDPPLRHPDEPPDGPDAFEDPFAEERARFGWRDDRPDEGGGLGDLVPFPGQAEWGPRSWERALPGRPALAPRAGQPWSVADDAALREAWLGADPGADRAELMRGLAARFGRTVGGVLNRLHRVGCDPSSPGTARGLPVLGTPALP